MKFEVDESIVKAVVTRFQVNERIFTTATSSQLLDALESQFKQRSESVKRKGACFVALGIEASFGSINRRDITEVSAQPTSDGFLIVADVKYRPSLWFWVILLLLFFTYVFWLIPIAFYLIQKKTVKEAIEDCFRNVKNEFSSNIIDPSGSRSVLPTTKDQPTVADIERLGKLLKQGLITQQEFDSHKAKLFGGSMPQPVLDSTVHALEKSLPIEREDERAAQLMFAQAREYVRNGQKEAAATALKSLINQFPKTEVAARAQKILAPRSKAASK